MRPTSKSPWLTEYRRQYTWKFPLDDPLPHTRPILVDTTAQVTTRNADGVTTTARKTDSAGVDGGGGQVATHRERVETLDENNGAREVRETTHIERVDVDGEKEVDDVTLSTSVGPKEEKGVEKQKKVAFVERGRTPNILPYGAGNTNPPNHENYMKTFNVMPNTESRVTRTKSYTDTHPPKATTRPKSEYDLAPDSLRAYLRAKEQVDRVTNRFQTEYRREFVDWSQSLKELEKRVKVGSVGGENGGVATVRETKSVHSGPGETSASDVVEVIANGKTRRSNGNGVCEGPGGCDCGVTESTRMERTATVTNDVRGNSGVAKGNPINTSTAATTMTATTNVPSVSGGTTLVDTKAATSSYIPAPATYEFTYNPGRTPTSNPTYTSTNLTTYPTPTSANLTNTTTKTTIHPTIVPYYTPLSIPAAGVSDPIANAYREKRHYPLRRDDIQLQIEELDSVSHQSGGVVYPSRSVEILKAEKKGAGVVGEEGCEGRVLRFAVEPPTTWRLAEELLKRAREKVVHMGTR
ncbi:hypothetical protein HK104_003982 [Borealophlyctis nickersoniae]|nr:hypothetical protein HK104_003982 [Borealophlyctis nickersoniae]